MRRPCGSSPAAAAGMMLSTSSAAIKADDGWRIRTSSASRPSRNSQSNTGGSKGAESALYCGLMSPLVKNCSQTSSARRSSVLLPDSSSWVRPRTASRLFRKRQPTGASSSANVTPSQTRFGSQRRHVLRRTISRLSASGASAAGTINAAV